MLSFIILVAYAFNLLSLTCHVCTEQEEEECLDKPAEMETNPSYKRCHLCVRIFSTKANLRFSTCTCTCSTLKNLHICNFLEFESF